MPAADALRAFSALRRCMDMSSEGVFESKLHFAVAVDSGADPTEGGVSKGTAGSGKLGGIQEVEGFPSELDTMTFANAERLEQGEVPGLLRGSIDQSHAGVAITLRSDEQTLAGAA